MNSSANLAETGISRSWNNTYTTVNNKTMYDANVDNFNDMLPDKTNTNYYHTVASGRAQAVLLPTGRLHARSQTRSTTCCPMSAAPALRRLRIIDGYTVIIAFD